jgi:hypothetical protein
MKSNEIYKRKNEVFLSSLVVLIRFTYFMLGLDHFLLLEDNQFSLVSIWKLFYLNFIMLIL